MFSVALCFVVLLLHVTSMKDAVPEILWGKSAVLEHTSCQFWRLKPNVSLPSLSEFTVCMRVHRSINSSAWNAFTYLHPDRSRVELGFGGRMRQLQVQLFGRSWVTEDALTVGHWHSVCFTWSCVTAQLMLVIDGRASELRKDSGEQGQDGGACGLAGGGSLTLGAAHYYLGDKLEVESGTNLQGHLTMFRVWGRARSVHEIATNTCTDGDIIKWHGRVWLMGSSHCTPVVDPTDECVWSLYELHLRLHIHGINQPIQTTSEAQGVTRLWLRKVLPLNFDLSSVVVFNAGSSWVQAGHGAAAVISRHKPNENWFEVLAHLNVIPHEDVGKIQKQVVEILKDGYHLYEDYSLFTNTDFMQVYPTDSIPHSTPETSITATDTPTTVTQVTAGISITVTDTPTTDTSITMTVTTPVTQSTPRMSIIVTDTPTTTPVTQVTQGTSITVTDTPTTTPVTQSTPRTSIIETDTPTTTPVTQSTPRTSIIETDTPTTTPVTQSTPRTSIIVTDTPTTTPVTQSTPRTSIIETDTPTTTPVTQVTQGTNITVTDTPTIIVTDTPTNAPVTQITPGTSVIVTDTPTTYTSVTVTETHPTTTPVTQVTQGTSITVTDTPTTTPVTQVTPGTSVTVTDTPTTTPVTQVTQGMSIIVTDTPTTTPVTQVTPGTSITVTDTPTIIVTDTPTTAPVTQITPGTSVIVTDTPTTDTSVTVTETHPTTTPVTQVTQGMSIIVTDTPTTTPVTQVTPATSVIVTDTPTTTVTQVTPDTSITVTDTPTTQVTQLTQGTSMRVTDTPTTTPVTQVTPRTSITVTDTPTTPVTQVTPRTSITVTDTPITPVTQVKPRTSITVTDTPTTPVTQVTPGTSIIVTDTPTTPVTQVTPGTSIIVTDTPTTQVTQLTQGTSMRVTDTPTTTPVTQDTAGTSITVTDTPIIIPVTQVTPGMSITVTDTPTISVTQVIQATSITVTDTPTTTPVTQVTQETSIIVTDTPTKPVTQVTPGTSITVTDTPTTPFTQITPRTSITVTDTPTTPVTQITPGTSIIMTDTPTTTPVTQDTAGTSITVTDTPTTTPVTQVTPDTSITVTDTPTTQVTQLTQGTSMRVTDTPTTTPVTQLTQGTSMRVTDTPTTTPVTRITRGTSTTVKDMSTTPVTQVTPGTNVIVTDMPTTDTSVTVTDTPTTTPATQTSDNFFKVSVNVTITGSEQDPEHILQTWLNETLSAKGMSVLNFRLTSSRGSVTRSLEMCRDNMTSPSTLAQSEFQMLVKSCSNVTETQKQIHHLLDEPYSNGSVYLDAAPEDIHITHIYPGQCPRHMQQTRQGLYTWSRMKAQHTDTQQCERNSTGKEATRQCLLDAVTSRAVWMAPNLQDCPTVVKTLSDLEKITVTNDTAVDVLNIIVDIMKESDALDEQDLWLVLNTLKVVLNVSVMTFDLAQVIINITSDILNSRSNLHPFTNYILNITDTVGNRMSELSNGSVSLVAAALALSVVDVDTEKFNNLTFGVTEMTSNPQPAVYINQGPAEGTVAFISLPPSFHANFPPNYNSNPHVQFQFYGVPELFQNCEGEKVLNTYVIAASVINAEEPIRNLKVPVVIMLHHLNTNIIGRDVQCVYWDFNKHSGSGGWNPSGCWKHNTTQEYTTCMCDHLTHFGVLLDISRTPIDVTNEKILTLITYTGCGVSSFFLGVTVLTYSLLEKLRRDYPSQILLNLSIALLGLNLVYLGNSWISSFGLDALCVAVATTQHYFLLASFTWMFLEAVNMYFALIKVFNAYVPSYILKFCFIGWGVPLLICSLVLLVKPDSYGLLHYITSEKSCWVSDTMVFYVCVVGVVGVILLVNVSVFLMVLLQVRRACASEHSGVMKELRGVTSLTLLLGLTWSTAFLAWGDARIPLLYVFSILNSLQGFFIFVFQCLMKENVRKQWRVHLCFGRFKLQEHSEWSHTPPVINKPTHSDADLASVRSNKSNSTQSSSASSHCTEHHFSVNRHDLGEVYHQSFLLPQVHTPLPEDAGHSTHSLSWSPKEVPENDVYFN